MTSWLVSPRSWPPRPAVKGVREGYGVEVVRIRARRLRLPGDAPIGASEDEVALPPRRESTSAQVTAVREPAASFAAFDTPGDAAVSRGKNGIPTPVRSSQPTAQA